MLDLLLQLRRVVAGLPGFELGGRRRALGVAQPVVVEFPRLASLGGLGQHPVGALVLAAQLEDGAQANGNDQRPGEQAEGFHGSLPGVLSCRPWVVTRRSTALRMGRPKATSA